VVWRRDGVLGVSPTASLANRLCLSPLRGGRRARDNVAQPTMLSSLRPAGIADGWDCIAGHAQAVADVVSCHVVYHQPEERRQRAGPAAGAWLGQLRDRLAFKLSQCVGRNGAPLRRAQRGKLLRCSAQFRIEAADAEAHQRRFHAIDDSGALANQLLAPAGRAFRTLLFQCWDRGHGAMLLLATQPTKEGTLEQPDIEPIGLRPPLLPRYRDAGSVVSHAKLYNMIDAGYAACHVDEQRGVSGNG